MTLGKKWKKEWAHGKRFARRDPDYVFPSWKDEKVYKKVKKAVEDYYPLRRECLRGMIIFSSRKGFFGERPIPKLKVTSEVLARLAEQGCTFSAYRTGYNTYLVDQINHEKAEIRLT